jgi:hypothetical protein
LFIILIAQSILAHEWSDQFGRTEHVALLTCSQKDDVSVSGHLVLQSYKKLQRQEQGQYLSLGVMDSESGNEPLTLPLTLSYDSQYENMQERFVGRVSSQ